MTRVPAVKKGRGASASRPVEAAPSDADRLDRLEGMLGKLIEGMGAIAGKAPATKPAPVDDDEPEEIIDRAAEKRAMQQREAAEDAAARDVIKLLEPRHLEIFNWLCDVQGKRPATIVKEMLRGAVIRERPAYREAQGKGGSSSRDISRLAERLPGKS